MIWIVINLISDKMLKKSVTFFFFFEIIILKFAYFYTLKWLWATV